MYSITFNLLTIIFSGTTKNLTLLLNPDSVTQIALNSLLIPNNNRNSVVKLCAEG